MPLPLTSPATVPPRRARLSPSGGRLLLVAALLVAVALTVFKAPLLLRDSEERLRDHFIRLQLASAPLQAETRLALVDIDETSLAALGPWPWPRARLAELVDTLVADYRVRAVALDMVLPEPADGAGDQRLALLAEHGPLVLSVAFDFLPRQPALAVGQLPPAPAVSATGAPPLAASGYIANHPGLARARCTGNIGFLPDADGVLRRLPAAVHHAGSTYPALAQAMVHCAGGEPVAVPGQHSQWRLPWRPRAAYTAVTAADVLAHRLPMEQLAGRYIIIGSSALGLADRVATPLEAAVPGALVHAMAASALLDGSTPASAQGLALLWCLLLAVLALFILPRAPAWMGALLLLAAALAWLPLAARAIAAGAEFSLLAPLLMAFALLLVAVPFEWWQAQRNSRRIRAIFTHYVAPSVLDQLLDQPQADPLAPRLCDITVLIADMEDYTRHTARLDLPEAARLTRDFLDAITGPVLATGGTLDKYTGDGLVAFWGAPLPCAAPAGQAVHAARSMLAAITRFNQQRVSAGFAPVRLRIGIESGRALVGDLGTPFRSAYTAVGDCINFAAKLQEAARDHRADLLIGPGACQHLPGTALQPLGPIALRGSDAPVPVCTLAAGH